MNLSLALLVLFSSSVLAQTTAPQYGQCAGIGWTGATTCPSGWTCTYSSDYYSQCLPGAAAPSSTGGSGTPTSTGVAKGPTPTLVSGWSFIRAVEDPNFHQYLRSEVPNAVSTAVLGDPVDAAQFVIQDGQLIQYANLSASTPLYAIVEDRANSTVMKLGISWSETPATEGTFVWSGDTVEWSIPTIDRPALNAWLVCPDAAGNKLIYINLGPYDYETPAGCADETIHAYTGPYPTS
ncbi:carbohydrate-binding module family 1 protein [Amylostereum chailletii]|nr:carbohydrate-binding module family 1 protein [Amylostereum chailletii]